MKKTLAVVGTVVALVMVPGMASAAEAVTVSTSLVMQYGGAETGAGATGGVVGMTAAGAAVLALFAGFGLWVRRALAHE